MKENLRTVAVGLALLLIFVIPFENLGIEESGATSKSRYVAILALAFWAYTALLRGGIRRLAGFQVAATAFFLWNIASILWTVDLQMTATRALTYLLQLAMVLMIWDLFTGPEEFRAGMQAYVLGAFVTIGGTIYNYDAGTAYYYERYAASGFNPNDAGMIIGLGICVAWHLALSRSRTWMGSVLALINFAYIPLAVFAIVVTASRVSYAAVALSLLYAAHRTRRVRPGPRVLVIVAVVAAAVSLYALLPQTSLHRALVKGLNLNERLLPWTEGLRIAADHPVLGIGTGAFRSVVESGKAPHNFALSIFTETGIVGLTLFLVVLVLAIRAASRQPPPERALWMTVLTIWLLGASLHNWEQRKQTWLFMSLIVLGASLRTEQRDARQVGSLPPSPPIAGREQAPLGPDST